MTTTMSAAGEPRAHRFLAAPETRRFLVDYVKKRVSQADVDDVVQTVLVEALASERMPEDETDMRKWLVGVARHKIADLHRRAGREQPAEIPDIEASPPPVEERQLAQWAEEQAKGNKEAKKTLDWMAREGEGDKLEHIAEEEKVPAARVRQRVSRMRRFMKERWLAELAAVAALAILALIVWKLVQRPVDIARDDEVPRPGPTVAPPPVAPKIAEAKEVRDEALDLCKRGEHRACLDGLDRAKELDPAGDATPEVQGAREAAQDAINAEDAVQQKVAPAPTAEASSAPPTTAVPTAKPPSTEWAPPQKAPPTKPPAPNPKAPPTKVKNTFDDFDKKGSNAAPPSSLESDPSQDQPAELGPSQVFGKPTAAPQPVPPQQPAPSVAWEDTTSQSTTKGGMAPRKGKK